VPGIPAIWLVVCTLTAGMQKLVGPISFTAAAQKYAQALADGKLLAPAKSAAEMQRIITNNYVDAALTGIFILLIITMLGFTISAILKAWRVNHPTAHEEPYVPLGSVPSP
jgi:carbon starvation protein CstA